MQIDDVRGFLVVAAAMVLANIVLLKSVDRARPNWLRRWLVISVGVGLPGGVVGGLLTGELLMFVIAFLVAAPLAIAQCEFEAWQRQSQREHFERLQEEEDSTLSPFLRSRAKKKPPLPDA